MFWTQITTSPSNEKCGMTSRTLLNSERMFTVNYGGEHSKAIGIEREEKSGGHSLQWRCSSATLYELGFLQREGKGMIEHD